MQNLAIEVQELTKSFGNRRVLRGINLSVERGEVVVICGPNGAGKTTLIKILTTIMKPSSGMIVVDGLQLKHNAEEIRRRIGIVTHETFLYGNLTAFENLEFYCRMYDVASRRERIQEVVVMLGMAARLHDRVSTLSRGMQQRLSIARALLHKPTLMLLDEPEVGLDQDGISILWRLLREEPGGKCGVILTTHNLKRALELGDRLLILHKGMIVYQEFTKGLELTALNEAYQCATRC